MGVRSRGLGSDRSELARTAYLLGRGCRKLHEGSAWLLVGRQVLRGGLTSWPKILQGGVNGLHVAVGHAAKVEPGHRRSELAARVLHELVRRHVLHEEAQVGGVRRPPWAPPAELVSGEP